MPLWPGTQQRVLWISPAFSLSLWLTETTHNALRSQTMLGRYIYRSARERMWHRIGKVYQELASSNQCNTSVHPRGVDYATRPAGLGFACTIKLNQNGWMHHAWSACTGCKPTTPCRSGSSYLIVFSHSTSTVLTMRRGRQVLGPAQSSSSKGCVGPVQ
jgi:hypothetical protein